MSEKEVFETCKRCGRNLKSKKSRERGYGDYCYKKAQQEKLKEMAGD